MIIAYKHTMSTKQHKDISQWVFLVEDEHVNNDGDEENKPQFCKLRHPRTGDCAMFLFSHSDKRISEVNHFKEEFGSWFIDQTVQQDGSLYMTTPVNPTYLVLPYLIKEEKHGKFKPLDQVIIDEDYPECHRLCQCENLRSLEAMCDVKGPDDFRAYKYNKVKSLSWLKNKVERLSGELEKQNLVVSGGARVASFIKSAKSDTNKEDYVRFAHGLVSEYLPESLSQDLKTHMGIKDLVIVHDKPPIDEPKSKRAKTDKVNPTEDYSNGKTKSNSTPAAKLSNAQKQLSKVDRSGMKNIASFFSPKQAKAK